MQFLIALLSTIIQLSERNEVDVKILQRVRQGEEPALAELYQRYIQILYSLAMRILQSSEETEDLMQEIFLQVWNKAASYEANKGTVYTWLVTITRNRAIDRMRSTSYRHHSRAVDVETIMLAADSRSSNPHSNTVLMEEQRSVVNALQRLTPDQQKVIGLAYYEGYSQSQIAEALNIPLGTVKTRMRKGLMELKNMLQEKK
jgi:RNA polymerase sigma-70 factor (ECF subfamily)